MTHQSDKNAEVLLNQLFGVSLSRQDSCVSSLQLQCTGKAWDQGLSLLVTTATALTTVAHPIHTGKMKLWNEQEPWQVWKFLDKSICAAIHYEQFTFHSNHPATTDISRLACTNTSKKNCWSTWIKRCTTYSIQKISFHETVMAALKCNSGSFIIHDRCWQLFLPFVGNSLFSTSNGRMGDYDTLAHALDLLSYLWTLKSSQNSGI